MGFESSSASGTAPGTTVAGVTVPLNADPLLLASLGYPNASPVFVNTFGGLDAAGRGAAAFGLPAGVAQPGFRLDFAYVRLSLPGLGLVAPSNAVPLTAR